MAAAVAYLFVDRPVASLQLDLQTAGQAISMLEAGLGKFFSTGRQADGKLRIIVFGMNQETFSGKFASVDAAVTAISGVIGANPDASDAGAKVVMLSKPTGLRIVIA
jgi:hypothetical protein